MYTISIISPFLNESDCILEYCRFIDNKAREAEYKIELIFVDDGSTDNTVELIQSFEFKYTEAVKLIKLSRNFGVYPGVKSALSEATGDFTTAIAVDMETPPDALDVMYAKLKSGYDAAFVEKKSIKVSPLNRLFSLVFSWMMRHFAVKNYGSGGTASIMFNRKIRDYLNSMPNSKSSWLLQVMDAGFKTTSVAMDYGKRFAGKSKWSFSKKVKLFIDCFVGFSYAPLRLVSIMGITLALIGFLWLILILILSVATSTTTVAGYPTLICVMLIGFGLTNISLGIIAEYLWRTLEAAKNEPYFIIDEIINIKD